MIKRTSLADAVAAQLTKQLSDGVYLVGDKLPTEPQLMKSFGVGRSSVREAIKILSNLGLLNVQQGLGTFIIRTNAEQEPLELRLKRASITEIDEVRQILELKIAEKAALRRTARNLEKIGRFLEKRRVAGQEGLLDECIQADIDFHVAIAEASHNEILFELYRSTSVHVHQSLLSRYTNAHQLVASQPLHEQLFDCISKADSKRALDIASKIIDEL